jgi:hypothetical protein
MLIVSCSSRTHRCLALLPVSRKGALLSSYAELLTCGGGEEFPHPSGVERTCGAEGPAESGTALRQIEAPRLGMHVRTTTRDPSTRIGDEHALDRYDSQ